MSEVQRIPKDSDLVLVTGASGFIGCQIVNLLLRNGYRVRGTVRSLANEKKIGQLRNLYPESKYPLELVEADLDNHDSLYGAVRGCRYVLHVACPVPGEDPKDADKFIKTVVNGTLSILQASQKHRIKRVVLTSSMVTISGDYSTRDPPGKVFTEDDWTDAATAKDTYIKGKTLAERAAWDFLAKLPDRERFELAVLNPSTVIGPVLGDEPGMSANGVIKLLAREISLIPRFNLPAVDVRDVALAHMRAMTLPKAAGRRTMVHSGTSLWTQEMAKILEHEFDPQGYDIPTTVAPYALLKLISLTDNYVKMMLPLYDKVQTYDSSKMQTILEITPRDVRQSVIDMAYSLIEKGFVKKTRNYSGPPKDTNYPSHS
jgi:nucleoside-diphosphate-sugar epimerase